METIDNFQMSVIKTGRLASGLEQSYQLWKKCCDWELDDPGTYDEFLERVASDPSFERTWGNKDGAIKKEVTITTPDGTWIDYMTDLEISYLNLIQGMWNTGTINQTTYQQLWNMFNEHGQESYRAGTELAGL